MGEIPSRSSQVHNTAACFPSDAQRETAPGRIRCHLDCPCHHPLKVTTKQKRDVVSWKEFTAAQGTRTDVCVLPTLLLQCYVRVDVATALSRCLASVLPSWWDHEQVISLRLCLIIKTGASESSIAMTDKRGMIHREYSQNH